MYLMLLHHKQARNKSLIHIVDVYSVSVQVRPAGARAAGLQKAARTAAAAALRAAGKG
jgi:hypothetical protein